jgi:hypothetical protein
LQLMCDSSWKYQQGTTRWFVSKHFY